MVFKLKKYKSKQNLITELAECRQQTLSILMDINAKYFKQQAHPDFSPIGWHFGHIAYTESLWLLKSRGHQESIFPENTRLYAADGLPKSERVNLPTIEETRNLLNSVRERVLDYFECHEILEQEKLLQFLLQHESQHGETILLVWKLLENQHLENPLINPESISPSPFELTDVEDMLKIPAGSFVMGSNEMRSLDNEKGEHQVYLDTYYLDRYPVTCGQFRQFMQAGGYENREWWSDAGWKWLQTELVTQPLYWCDHPASDYHPVCGVSWYEAEAYCQFVGKRLPTEAEWEKAARWDEDLQVSYTYPWGEAVPNRQLCNFNTVGLETCGETTGDASLATVRTTNPNSFLGTSPVHVHPDGKSPYGMHDALGNVWEWTASWFAGYPQFQPYPYRGYSQTYFDNQHRVLKGCSFATRKWSLRTSFRNWYYPGVRQVFAGFRCAKDDQ